LSADTKKREEKPLSPVEARKHVGKKITVEMTVKASKNALSKRGEIYLDSEENFRDVNNFAVVITKKGAASLEADGINDPATHFLGKAIRAKGMVSEVDRIPRIAIDDVRQIRLSSEK
jgi:DNA/RNA endonuclease YhcR with UshA esterase domain